MHVFYSVSAAYAHSAELRLFEFFFRQKLPADCVITPLIRPGDDGSAVIREALARTLAESGLQPYFLIVKEPSLFLGTQTVAVLQELLDTHPELDCVLPSDIRGHRTGHQADYLTLSGFERFIHRLQDPNAPITPYDGRPPFLFLIRSEALQRLDLPDDPFGVPALLKGRAAISLNAYVHPFFEYYTEQRADLIPFVPPHVRNVLDIGCTRGGFGAALKTARRCRVVGVEQNAAEGAKARRVLDEVIIGDALQVTIPGKFDCVTCLDTLEHFVEPARLLERIATEFLLPGGHLLLSVPNIGHWSVVEDLLAGRFDYLPVGLLCNTHLRFFTDRSLRRLLAENGFTVQRIEGVRHPMPTSVGDGIETLAEQGMEIDLSSLETLNHIVLAVKV